MLTLSWSWGGIEVACTLIKCIEVMLICITMHIVTVAPLAGAWVETFDGTQGAVHRPVAPLAGAWVETYSITTYYS